MVNTLSLDGVWLLNWFEVGNGLAEGAEQADYNDGGWLAASVPGEVHLDLIRAGVIRGEYYDRSADDIKWAEKCEWWYRKTFVPDPALRAKHVELVFDGLDTLATVYLNGRAIGRNDNMHVPLRIDVASKLKWGKRNVLAVRLDPVDRLAEGKSLAGLYTTTCSERLFVRKAQVSFGWDFHGRMITAGIWQHVRVESWELARLESVQILAEPASKGGGDFTIRVSTRGGGATVEVSIRAKGSKAWQVTRTLPGGKGEIHLANARLWWPWTCGTPNLYEVRVQLLAGDGEVLDAQTHRVGVRKIEVAQDPIEDGTRFGLRINGRDVYICGANWVPPSPYFADVTEQTYRKLLSHAVNGNIGMLRVWGGGVYELDSFYDLCDEMGILLWQDFMWACGVYPDGPGEQKNAKREAEYQIARLRNHPSLAVWSGDNEDDWAFQWGQLPHKDKLAYKLTRKVLPAAVKKLDPTRPYFPSSPFSPTPTEEDCNSSREGDQHQYRWQSFETTGDKSYTNFFKDRSRFVSEFGHVSLPGLETLAKYNFTRKDMDIRQRFSYLVTPPNAPSPLHGTITGLQFMHAQFQKRALEHYRRLWPVCSGTLHWKFNDPYSSHGLGWGLMASIDPAGVAKMSYYYAKRAYMPLAVSLKQEDEKTYSAWVCNSTNKGFRGRLRVELHHQDNRRRTALDINANVPADTSMQVGIVSLEQMGFTRWEDYRDNVAAIHLEQDGREVFYDTHWLMDIRREAALVLIWGQVQGNVQRRSPDELAVTLTADRYVRPVELVMPGADVCFQDNFIDLLPNQPRTVTIRRWPWSQEDLTNRLIWVRGWNFKWLTLET